MDLLMMRIHAMQQAYLHERKVSEHTTSCHDQRGESAPVRSSIPLTEQPCHDWPSSDSDKPRAGGAHVQDGGPPELHEALLFRQAGGQELLATDEAQS